MKLRTTEQMPVLADHGESVMLSTKRSWTEILVSEMNRRIVPTSTAARSILVLFVVLSGGVCDQVTKLVAESLLSDGTVWSLFGDAVRLQLVHNQGGVMSLGASSPAIPQWLLVAWVACTLISVLAYALFSQTADLPVVVAAALLFAGGASNLTDRLLHHGSVIDFITINMTALRMAVFNLADLAIIAGFFLLAIVKVTSRKRVRIAESV
jgi:signal peptidase II